MGSCQIEECLLKAEIGMIHVLCCNNGVHKITVLPHDTPVLKEGIDDDIVVIKNAKVGNATDCVISWLKSYFGSSLDSHKKLPPICSTVYTNKGDFTVKVWKTLMNQVTFGQTISYSELAALSGNNNASRAVGGAMKNNSIPLIIPCHRVIKSDGKIGNFSCGTTVKEWLLKHENVSFKI